METLIVVVHVLVAISIVGLVLLQHGKGADAGASFGAGASQTVFGASGSGNFLVRATTVAATIFFVTSLSLAIFAKNQSGLAGAGSSPVLNQDILQEVPGSAVSDVPQLDEAPALNSSGDDVPNLPDTPN
ncbi:MAG: preprotein translocase subunit SecG [SAR86 cluster bacterium]|uniref:Protein-export membrane protein SecG n=1 Tax=SAR86 cluster bacterium TaxID=2030880 RepID=A0A2A5ATX7_9GAMM|nr:MAG: preprotein translocase subunit SecG [SAR86 cluster bacterium]